MKARYLIPLALLAGCTDQQAIDRALLESAELGKTKTVAELLRAGGNVNAQDSCKFSPLLFAAQNGNSSIAGMLIDANASVNHADKGGYTPLMQAAAHGHIDLIKILLESGAETDLQEETHGWTALIWAANRGQLESVRLLLEAGANSSVTDREQMTALNHAIIHQHHGIVALIAEYNLASLIGKIEVNTH